jgi:hypothetical protein
MKLAKKIPVFNRRAENLPEILITLYEYHVPVVRAVWYIKMLATQSTNSNEVQKKKRQPNQDPSCEWTQPLVKLLKDIFNRMKDHQQSGQQSATAQASIESFLNTENSNLTLLTNITNSYLSDEKVKGLWDYATKLMRAMLDQNLLDKQLILDLLLDLFERCKGFDKILKQILVISKSSIIIGDADFYEMNFK